MSQKFDKLPLFTQIRETYTVDGVLGEGAFGVVYKVRHKFLGIQALKVFHPEKMPPQKQDDLLSEAFILAKITHPNVVRVFDANHFEWQGRILPYVAMEYVSGGTLDRYLRQKGLLPVTEAVEIQKMILRGLSQAHLLSPPVIHRDVKPQNIMVKTDGGDVIVKVSDFGQAKHVDPLTRLADSAGTLAYMAPEGFWNYKSAASDVYSAGIVFYILLTGKTPFEMPAADQCHDEKTVERAVRRSRQIPPVPPSQIRSGLSPSWDSVILRALHNEPGERYQNAGDFLKAIEDVAATSSLGILNGEKLARALALGKQYRDLPEAIEAMESVLREVSSQERQELLNRYGPLIESWKKGMIM